MKSRTWNACFVVTKGLGWSGYEDEYSCAIRCSMSWRTGNPCVLVTKGVVEDCDHDCSFSMWCSVSWTAGNSCLLFAKEDEGYCDHECSFRIWCARSCTLAMFSWRLGKELKHVWMRNVQFRCDVRWAEERRRFACGFVKEFDCIIGWNIHFWGDAWWFEELGCLLASYERSWGRYWWRRFIWNMIFWRKCLWRGVFERTMIDVWGVRWILQLSGRFVGMVVSSCLAVDAFCFVAVALYCECTDNRGWY